MKKSLKSLLGAVLVAVTFNACSGERPISKSIVVQVWNECVCEITFHGPNGSPRIIYDCQESKYYPLYLEEGTYQVVADDGYGHVMEMEFVKGKYAQDLGIVF